MAISSSQCVPRLSARTQDRYDLESSQEHLLRVCGRLSDRLPSTFNINHFLLHKARTIASAFDNAFTDCTNSLIQGLCETIYEKLKFINMSTFITSIVEFKPLISINHIYVNPTHYSVFLQMNLIAARPEIIAFL